MFCEEGNTLNSVRVNAAHIMMTEKDVWTNSQCSEKHMTFWNWLNPITRINVANAQYVSANPRYVENLMFQLNISLSSVFSFMLCLKALGMLRRKDFLVRVKKRSDFVATIMAVHCPNMNWLRRNVKIWKCTFRLENPERCVLSVLNPWTLIKPQSSPPMFSLTLCVLVLCAMWRQRSQLCVISWQLREMIICCRFWREFHNDRVPPSGSTHTHSKKTLYLFSSEPRSKMTSYHNRVSHM